MNLKLSIICISLLLIANSLNGQEEMYHYKRPITGVTDQWHSIGIPQDVLNKTNSSITDIRVIGYDDAGKEVKIPYVLKSLKSEVVIEHKDLKVFNKSRRKDVFVYVTEKASVGKINQLKIDIKNSNFEGRAKLEGKDGELWFTIVDDYRIFSFDKGNISYKYTTLDIPNSDYISYRISLSEIKSPILNNVSVALKNEKLGKYFDIPSTIRHVKEDEANSSSIYSISLDSISRISQLSFDVEGDRDHYRRMKLSAITDSIQTNSGWKNLENTFFYGALTSYEKDKLFFDEQLVKDIQMTVYNNDDQRLQINSVTANVAEYKLLARFVGPLDYYLFYGYAQANAPRFDISRFQESIPDEMLPVHLGQPSDNVAKATLSNFFISTPVLYAIMVFIIALLGWFTVKMLSTEK